MALPTIVVKNSAGSDVTINTLPNAGRVAATESVPFVMSTEDKAALDLVATAANQAAQTTLIGAVNETAPASDTASSGLNGRLQRIAQNITTFTAWALNTLIGSLTETAPASDTASSGLNGRLQRIAQRITAMFGTAGSASSNVLSVQGIASGTNLAVVSNNSEIKASATFTRPADTTAYAAGDLVANSTTAGSVVAMSFTSMVRTAGDCVRLERARLTKTGTSLTNAQFRLHLFEDVPVPSVGDNAAFQTSNALSTTKVLNYIGSFSFTLDRSGSDGASGRAVPDTTFPITTSPVSGTTLYGLLEATAAYTPANAEVFVLTLEGFRT